MTCFAVAGFRTFLVAPGLSYLLKAVTPQDTDHLIGTEPRRAAINQPSPRPASRSPAVRDRWALDKVQWLPGCLRGLPPRFHQLTHNRGVRGTLPSRGTRRSRCHPIDLTTDNKRFTVYPDD